jgi:3',5'-cyclic AMP phosphodiesterase CpdA
VEVSDRIDDAPKVVERIIPEQVNAILEAHDRQRQYAHGECESEEENRREDALHAASLFFRSAGRAEFGYPDGQRYYSVALGGATPLVEVFVLDSNTLANEQAKLRERADTPQLSWLDAALDNSEAVWKIITMHHPMYGPTGDRFLWSGHQADIDLRRQLGPLLEGRVDAVFQGHNHLYARSLPQHGIRYFVAGGGGSKPYKFKPDSMTVSRADRGELNHSVYVRATEEMFEYCVIDADGQTRDGGWFGKG